MRWQPSPQQSRLGLTFVVIGILAGLAMGQLPAVLLGGLSVASASGSISDTYAIPGLAAIPPHEQLGGPVAPDTVVVGTIVFPGEQPAMQSQLVQSIYDPQSPMYHHFLSGNQYDQMFAPPVAQQDLLRGYLTSYGVQVDVVNPFFWNVQGSAHAMSGAFHTTFDSVRSHGGVGYYPASAPQLPNAFRGLNAEIQDGFQTLNTPQPADLMHWNPKVPAPASSGSPRATLTLNMTMTNGAFFLYTSTAKYVNPPTNMNGTYELNITGGSAPYTVTWNWGDGSHEKLTATGAHLYANHMYYLPAQADYCNSIACWNLTVSVTDGAGDTGSMTVGVFTGFSPQTAQLYYDEKPLLKLGDTGQGTKIGLGEMCDPSFANSQYMADANEFSSKFGLPLFTASTLVLMGSGASSCSYSSSGWSGETMLDIEWAHVFAPNATLEVDLANSDPGEGDSTWLTTSNGVFIASNSWGGAGGSYDTTWNQAAAQGQSYLTASGDCGSAGLSSSYPADIPTGVGVGGTQVYPLPSGAFGTEYAWNGTTDPTGCANDEGSTGGYTTAYPAPTYQQGMQGFGTQDPSGCTSTTCRGVPDIAAIGGTWVELVYNGAWTLSAGTSLACPSSAAMLDVMYQFNGTATKGNGMANYAMYAIGKGTSYHTGFFDILIGNNMVSGSGYTEQPGWSPVTGLGSFNVSQMAQLLAKENGNPSPYAPLTVVMSSNVTYGQPNLAVSFGADAAGGSAPLTGYSYNWSFGDGTSSTTTTYYATHTYTKAGVYSAKVTVTQAANTAASNTVTVVVTSSPSSVGNVTVTAFTVLPSPGTVGTSMVFSVTASGGVSPYTYAYAVLPPGCASVNSSTLTCTPTASGTWNTTVTVTDASHTSSTKTLSVVVNPKVVGKLTVNSFTASPNPVTQGAATQITDNVTGGTAPYTYSYSGLPTGCSGGNTYVFTCVPTVSGTFTVSLGVTDASSNTASGSLSLVVSPVGSSPLALSAFTVTPSTVATGASATFTASVSGGYPAYTYSYLGIPPGCSAGNVSTFACAPLSAGTYTVSLNVKDAKGTQVWGNATLMVQAQASGGPTISSFVASPSVITLGSSTTFTTAVSGGKAPYAFSFSGLPPGCSSSTPTFSCKPTISGSFSVYVTVTDANSASYAASTGLIVNPFKSSMTTPTLAISVNTVSVNSPVTFTTTVSGGVQPYTFAYSGLPQGCSSQDLAQFTCSPTQTGQFSIAVTVTDSSSYTANSTKVSLNVESINSGNSNNGNQTILGLGLFDWLLIAVIVGVVVVVAAVAVRHGRNRGRESAPPPSAQPWVQPPPPTQYPNWQSPPPSGYPPLYPPPGSPPGGPIPPPPPR